MTAKKLKPHEDAEVGYLAVRNEDDFVNAYFTRNETLRDAQLIGCIARVAAEDKELKMTFVFLMRQVVRVMQEQPLEVA